MSVLRRLLLASLLVAAMGALTVDYAANAGDTTSPSKAELDESYTEYHGERVVVWFTVTAVGDGQFSAGNWTVEVTPVPASLDPGDTVEVGGTARPGRVVEADSVSVVDATNRRYLYGVSALALVASGLFVCSRWRLDTAEWALVPRDGGDAE